MLLLFSSDLHGNKLLYKKLIYFCVEYRPDIVLLGGDLFPKSGNNIEIFSNQKKFAQNDFVMFLSHIKAKVGSSVGVMLGNDDFSVLKDVLLPFQDKEVFRLIDNKLWDTGLGWDVIGFNLVPETPFYLKDLERIDEPDIEIKNERLDGIISTPNGLTSINVKNWFVSNPSLSEELTGLPSVTNPDKTILVSHAPPYNTSLDMLFDGTHVGSKSIKTYIEKTQPAICLHGHIHESFYVSKKYHTTIGNSICFNPGQIHIPNLDAVLIDTESPFKSHKHTHGLEEPSESGMLFLKPPLQN